MGDLLNPIIFERLFNVSVEKGTGDNANAVAIGSGLAHFLCPNNEKARKLAHLFAPKLHVWGYGFINDINCTGQMFYRHMQFHAVRGKLTLQKIRSLTGKKQQHVVLGDGGILADKLIKHPETKYDIGVIPHFRERDHPFFSQICKKYENSILINLSDEPFEVIDTIASCRSVCSSSLHGLIVADSFHIPNIHIKVTDNLKGDGYKFRDYYSAYDLEDEVCQIASLDDFPSISQIISEYKVIPDQVEKVKQNMTDCFPFNWC